MKTWWLKLTSLQNHNFLIPNLDGAFLRNFFAPTHNCLASKMSPKTKDGTIKINFLTIEHLRLEK
jgi:hypothetical protein